MRCLLYCSLRKTQTERKPNKTKRRITNPLLNTYLLSYFCFYGLNIFCTFMIGKTLSLTGSKFALYFQMNKQMKRYFLEKTNFFQLRKIFTSEYTTNTLQVRTESTTLILLSILKPTNTKTNFKHKERK